MNTPQPSPNRSILYGLLSLAGGIGFIYYFIWRPLEAMAQKQDNISYSYKGVGIGPFFVVFGLYLLIMRPAVLKPAQMSQGQRVIYWVMVGLSLVLAIGTFLWFKHRVGELGYSI
ncbi:hypothetical protein AAHN97_11830 [Chitinophaga niabensis]|uniref:hypothetical protein n=1 Tax=Chitinophaga niabensis TaxID=536979 RepID=UPI0031BA7DB7